MLWGEPGANREEAPEVQEIVHVRKMSPFRTRLTQRMYRLKDMWYKKMFPRRIAKENLNV